jgi:hypothetical protein
MPSRGVHEMPRKLDLSAQRLRRHMEMESDPLAHAVGVVNDAALLGAAYKAAQEFRETDWDDVAQRSLAAHHALSLDDLDGPLKKAFQAFGLEPRNPFHWRKLLAYFSAVHFNPRQPRRGPHRLWSDDRLCQLLQDCDQIRRQRALVLGSKISDLEVCKWLKRHSTLGKAYAGFDAKTLLRNLQRARNPRENARLGEMFSKAAELSIAQLRAATKSGVVLDQKWERLVRSMVLKQAIRVVASGWRQRPEEQATNDPTHGKAKLSLDFNDPAWIATERRAGLGY